MKITSSLEKKLLEFSEFKTKKSLLELAKSDVVAFPSENCSDEDCYFYLISLSKYGSTSKNIDENYVLDVANKLTNHLNSHPWRETSGVQIEGEGSDVNHFLNTADMLLKKVKKQKQKFENQSSLIYTSIFCIGAGVGVYCGTDEIINVANFLKESVEFYSSDLKQVSDVVKFVSVGFGMLGTGAIAGLIAGFYGNALNRHYENKDMFLRNEYFLNHIQNAQIK